MGTFRIALANLPFPKDPEDSVRRAEQAIERAGDERAGLVCFPECYVPGYRVPEKRVPPPDAGFLERAWSGVTRAAARAKAAVILGTERVVKGRLHATALVVGSDGAVLGFQDKVQLDPSEEGLYWPGWERRVFESGPLTFGIAICQLGSLFAVEPNTSKVSLKPRPQVLLVDPVMISKSLPSGRKRNAACPNCIFLPLISPLNPE